jgi:dehydrodolichyl diphosphate syntase complex subunit NUS1
MVLSKETKIYREDVHKKGTGLTPQQREEVAKPYLPLPRAATTTSRKRLSQPVRDFATNQLHLLVFMIVHTVFSAYIRIRQTYHICVDKVFAILYYHHRAPELIKQDVKNLSRLPEHLSVILELKSEERGTAGLESLMDELAEISAWCACVGIPMLSVYEKTGR